MKTALLPLRQKETMAKSGRNSENHAKVNVKTELPSAGRVSLLHQADKKRYVVHLLYGPPIKRGRCEVIEDLPFLYNVPVEVDLPQKIKKVYSIPDMKELVMTKKGGNILVTVLEFQCHTGIVFEY